jgi:hypothetical protein
MRAVFSGDAARSALTSAPRRIDVLPRLDLSLGRTRVRLGRRLKAQGHASAPAQSVRLTLQRRGRRRWYREQRRVLPVADDAYTLRLRPHRRGRYRVIAQAGRVKRYRRLSVY